MSLKKIISKNILLVFVILSFSSISAQLKQEVNQADYIIITPSKFIQTLQPFIEWREQKNLKIAIAELSQIYTEFPDSTESSSIRNFLSYSLSYWEDPKPKYVLLVGGTDFLPSYRVSSRFVNFPNHPEDSVSVDEWYSINLYESNTDPDIALGRFPINNEDELDNVINKTIRFEDSLSLEDYSIVFLFLTDKEDSSEFERKAEQFINSHLPSNISYKSIYAGDDSTIEVSRERLFNALSKGTIFLSYYGHGAPYKWSKYDLFTFEDVKNLEKNYLPFIYTAAACSQSFDLPGDSSIVRNLIASSGNGTVASVAASGLNYLNQGSSFLEKFYDNIFEQPNISLGQALLQAKISSNFDNSIDAISRRYTLLGDPALKIKSEIIAQITDQSKTIPDSYTLKQNYPNPFNPSTTISYSIPQSGFVIIKVNNILGQEVTTLVNELKHAGTYEVEFNGLDLSSGVYFYQMKVNDFVEVKKFMLLK